MTAGVAQGLCQCGCGAKAPVATRTSSRWNQVRGEPLRFIVGHHRRKYDPYHVEEDRGYRTPCWIWQRAFNFAGYGKLMVAGRCLTAHRVYYERDVGSIPEGLYLDHLCRVRACVNPDHLEPVTPAENIRRGKSTKLTHRAVRDIRSSGDDLADLAARYGITPAYVRTVQRGLRWTAS